ncbi:MAG: hypothetical protein JW982_11885 [Spirochaetes bacterium]|nr:hypothetical protein [Spirochaetota bacterium]
MVNSDIHCTSANMDIIFFNKLNEASCLFDISCKTIFKDLIKTVKQNIHCKKISGILTEYQNHSPECWKKFNYSLDNNEIEIFGLLRQKYKISISKLAFIGFILFWELLMHKYKERLKLTIPKEIIFSYLKIQEKFKYLIPVFRKRLEISKLE